MSNNIDIYSYPSDPSLVPAYRIAVMQAALEGKPLQFFSEIEGLPPSWENLSRPTWNWAVYKYRIDPASKPKPVPKTVKGWLETLPAGYRERALANLEKAPFEPGVAVCSMSAALLYGYLWSKTPEGDSFWHAVHTHFDLDGQNPLPSLPKKVVKEWRPWTPETLPLGDVWLRPNANRAVRQRIVGYTPTDIRIGRGSLGYDSALRLWEHSLDGGVNWSRCGTEVA